MTKLLALLEIFVLVVAEKTSPIALELKRLFVTRFSTKKEVQIPNGEKYIWIIDSFTPNPKRDSGSVRILEIIRIFEKFGYTVLFTPMRGNAGATDWIAHPLRFWNVVFQFMSSGRRPEFIWICRLPNILEVLLAVKRYFPSSPVVFDTVDLHSLRIYRNINGNKSVKINQIASKIFQLEIKKILEADLTILVSQAEIEFLPENARKKLSIISNVHHVTLDDVQISWESRKGIVFIGNFKHLPNLTGLNWFTQNVWPQIEPEVRAEGLYVIGSPSYRIPRKVFDRKNIHVLGYVSKADQRISESRLSIAPLLSGAGVKGKIGQSLALGVPVVATSIAVEGMHVQSGREVLVADNPLEFAKHVVNLYKDRKLNANMATSAKIAIENHFSPQKAEKDLKSLISFLVKAKSSWRDE